MVGSCIRHFDNLRRIFNSIDDFDFQVSCISAQVGSSALTDTKVDTAATLCKQYLLDPSLAWEYSSILFLLKHRCQIQSSKKKLQHISWYAQSPPIAQ